MVERGGERGGGPSYAMSASPPLGLFDREGEGGGEGSGKIQKYRDRIRVSELSCLRTIKRRQRDGKKKKSTHKSSHGSYHAKARESRPGRKGARTRPPAATMTAPVPISTAAPRRPLHDALSAAAVIVIDDSASLRLLWLMQAMFQIY